MRKKRPAKKEEPPSPITQPAQHGREFHVETHRESAKDRYGRVCALEIETRSATTAAVARTPPPAPRARDSPIFAAPRCLAIFFHSNKRRAPAHHPPTRCRHKKTATPAKLYITHIGADANVHTKPIDTDVIAARNTQRMWRMCLRRAATAAAAVAITARRAHGKADAHLEFVATVAPDVAEVVQRHWTQAFARCVWVGSAATVAAWCKRTASARRGR